MATERFEAPLERLRSIEEHDIDPIRRKASGFIDYDYYYLRVNCTPADEVIRVAQRTGTAI